jgi:hypothetical protein
MRLKFRAFVLPVLLFFSLSTVTAPARAVLPLIAAGVAFITEGGMAANGLAALTVGTVAGVIYLGNQSTGTGSESGSFMEIPLGTSRDRPLSTPNGYTAPINNDAQPMPPGTIAGSEGWQTGIYLGWYGAAGSLNSVSAAFFIWAGYAALGHWSATPSCVASDANFICTYAAIHVGYTDRIHLFIPYASCPAGYTMSSGSCVLSNASLVMKPADGRCQVLASVSGFTVDPQDPECSGLATQTGTTVAPSSITSNKPGWLSNGKVVVNADGSRTITYSTTNTTNNTTTTTTVNMVPAAGGQTAMVTGSSVVTVPGTGNLAAPATPAAPTIDFPDDYNREITQGQIKTGIDTLHGDLDSAGFSQPAAPAVAPADLVIAENKKITDELALSVTTYDNFKLLDWSTWIPVLPASSCSPVTGNVMGRTVSIDLCPKIAMLNELIGWMLAVYATWSVVMMAFRKD